MELYFSPFPRSMPAPRPFRHREQYLWPGGGGRIDRLVALIRLWRRRAYERRLLARFGERERTDLALTPADIARESSKPFWRS